MPITSRPGSPAHSEASNPEQSQSQPQPQPRQHSLARAVSTSTTASSHAGSLHARTHSSRSVSRDDSLGPSLPKSSRSRSGSVEPSLGADAKSRSRSRSVSFAVRSAGGIRPPVQRPGMRPAQGPRGKTKMRQVNSAPGVGLGRPCRFTGFFLPTR